MRREPASGKALSAVLLLGLAGLNVWLAVREIDSAPIRVDAAKAETTALPVPAARVARPVPALDSLAETRARPLFNRNRRPPAPESAAPARVAEAEAERPDGFRLVGIMGQGTAPKRALIRTAETRIARWVDVGGEIGGWRLAAIGRGTVTIERGSSRVELKLHAPKKTDADEISREPPPAAP